MFKVWKYENERFISMWKSFLRQLFHSLYSFYFSLSYWPKLLLSQGVLMFHITYSVLNMLRGEKKNMLRVSWTVSGNKVFIVWELFGLMLKSWKSFQPVCQRRRQPGPCCDGLGSKILHLLVRQQDAVWGFLSTVRLCWPEFFFSLGPWDHIFIPEKLS